MTRAALFLAACTMFGSWSVCRADDLKKVATAPVTEGVVPACHKNSASCANGACPSVDCPDCAGCKEHFKGDRGQLHRKHRKCKECATCTASSCGDCCSDCVEQKSCFKKLCGWFFYCKKTPKCATCNKCCSCCCGPLYQFFLCTPIPAAHIGDGYYIGQYPSRADHDYMPGVILPPPCHCPTCPTVVVR